MELSKKIASGGLGPVRLWAVGTGIASGDVFLGRLFADEVLVRDVLGAGDGAGRRNVLEPMRVPSFPDALGDAVPHMVLAEFGHQPRPPQHLADRPHDFYTRLHPEQTKRRALDQLHAMDYDVTLKQREAAAG